MGGDPVEKTEFDYRKLLNNPLLKPDELISKLLKQVKGLKATHLLLTIRLSVSDMGRFPAGMIRVIQSLVEITFDENLPSGRGELKSHKTKE